MIFWEKYPHKVGVCLKGEKKCLHVGTVLFVGSVFVGTEFVFDCRVGLVGTGVGEGVGGGIVCLSARCIISLLSDGWSL